MTRHKWVAASGLIIGVLVLGLAIFLLFPGGPKGGLSRPDAIRIARTHAGPQPTGVISAEIRKNFYTGFDIPIHTWSWVVTFSGTWELICTGGCARTSEWVAIDYYTGNWIASEYAYPSALRTNRAQVTGKVRRLS